MPNGHGLAEIDDLGKLIVLGRIQLLEWNHVTPEECERERVAVTELARAVTAQLRDEYLARSQK